MRQWIALWLVCSGAAHAQAIRYNTGFFTANLSRGDDATTDAVPLGFLVNFQGRFHNFEIGRAHV